MSNKQEMVNSFIDALKNSFVYQYDEIDLAKTTVNQYMKDIEFDYEYDYNTFCIEFINIIEQIFDSLDDEYDITEINLNLLIYESLTIMVRNKIFDTINDEDEKHKLMMLHELKKYLIKNEK